MGSVGTHLSSDYLSEQLFLCISRAKITGYIKTLSLLNRTFRVNNPEGRGGELLLSPMFPLYFFLIILILPLH